MNASSNKIDRVELLKRFASIKLLALDVDGVLTDDSIYVGPDGFELKKFNISDGFYMVLAQRAGLPIAIVSGRYSAATDCRMKELGVQHVLQGRKDKVLLIESLLNELSLSYDDIAFVGNEILDISLANRAGLSIAVANSCQEFINVVDWVTTQSGGAGAVREVLELWFEAVKINPKEYLS